VRDASQGGNIPKAWLDLGGWEDYDKDPPDRLWRTLVADRGRDNRNPPYYYARACKESVHKGGITSGRVNTTALINNERNSIVAEFCRRVHAVIWNRCLFKTESGKLGLASKVQKGDKVCILYGCTVPVILRRHEKKREDLEKEIFEDQIEALKSCYVKMVERRERKSKAMEKLKQYTKEERDKLNAVKDEASYVLETRKLAKKAAEEARKKQEEARKDEENARKAEEQKKQADELLHSLLRLLALLLLPLLYFASLYLPEEDAKRKEEESVSKKPEDLPDERLYYEFNGECYIHGMMDGEALREKFYRQLPNRIFELR